MPITHCPGCNQQLEVPDVVPGGLVSCPYCAHEFPVKSKVVNAPRGPARGGRGRGRRPAPRRGPPPRNDGYEDDYGGGGYNPRRRDMTPMIVGITLGVLVLGIAAFLLLKGSGKKVEDRRERLTSVQQAAPATYQFTRTPDDPYGDPLEMRSVFNAFDKVTITRFTHSENLVFKPRSEPKPKSVHGYTLDYMTEEGGENVVAADEGRSDHEGTYTIKSIIQGSKSVLTDATVIKARFLTDRRGFLMPGSYEQTDGPSLPVPPEVLANRGFGMIPQTSIRPMETWGADQLVNPLARHVTIDGRSLSSILGAGQRQGGWRIHGGKLQKREDGRWTRKAIIDIRLQAVENHHWTPTTYRGQQAQISCGVLWQGKIVYNLYKQMVQKVEGLSVQMKVRIKTADTYYDWTGSTMTDYQMYRDP